jgi:hypothetical protein
MQLKVTRLEFISPCHFHGSTVSSVASKNGSSIQWDTELNVVEVSARGQPVIFPMSAIKFFELAPVAKEVAAKK